ncbi:MAG: hypothetical protein ACREH4_14115 [Vitreimonas sp.]
MLAVTSYPQRYIDECRARMQAQIAAYKTLVSSAGKDPAVRSAIESFEPLFFNNLTLVLEDYFVHRTRAMEGKDGNPLNEVRMLCNSILRNQGVLCADKTIKYQPETSVLRLRIGDEVRLNESQFLRLFRAYFAELRNKFT